MKKFLFSQILGAVAFASSGFALSGGPFDNDDPTTTGGSGTYQGIARGPNVTGIVIFGYSNTAGSSGRFVFFSSGIARAGNVQGVVNFSGRRIAGVIGGSDSTEASGAFDARIVKSFPVLTAVGTGDYSGPGEEVTTDTLTTATDITTSTGTITGASTTSSSSAESIPFDITLTRTSLTTSTFTATITTIAAN